MAGLFVQTRLSLSELHKAVQREVGYMESAKREGCAMGTAVLNSGVTVCTLVPYHCVKVVYGHGMKALGGKEV